MSHLGNSGGRSQQRPPMNGRSRYQRQFGNFGGRGGSTTSHNNKGEDDNAQSKSALAAQMRRAKQIKGNALDRDVMRVEEFFMSTNSSSSSSNVIPNQHNKRNRRGWLYNVLPTTVTRSDDRGGTAERAGVDLFFCGSNDSPTTQSSSGCFKTTLLYRPYFYLLPEIQANIVNQSNIHNSNKCGGASGEGDTDDNGGGGNDEDDMALELVRTALLRLYEERGLHSVEIVYRMDLDQPNHLSPQRTRGRPMLKLVFDTVSQLMDVREAVLRDYVKPNQKKQSSRQHHLPTLAMGGLAQFGASAGSTTTVSGKTASATSWLEDNPLSCLVDLREYDVPYVVRVCIDMDIRCGTWYTVVLDDEGDNNGAGVKLVEPDRESKANPVTLAFDIECTKAPLKFPSAEVDQIFMISYMVSSNNDSNCSGQGYLIVSRSVVSQDIEDFEYTPKPNYPGPFIIFNEPDEKALLQRFFAEYRRHGPQIVVTYNGDFFDWPFVEARAQVHGLDLCEETGGIALDTSSSQYRGRATVHLDAFHWVQRDSYLPQGSQGLKAVTREKLGYDPVEVDPEDMVPYAQERPVHMATYSVSDAVATWYLHEKYVHLFIFSLCTIIPMGPEDVLSKGSGTLCETLLMVQAFQGSIICPNKEVEKLEQFHKGHLLESETYIGGKVECLETGVYRSDIEYEFDLKPQAFDELIQNIDRDLMFAIEVESKKKKEDILNYDEVRNEIVDKLKLLRDRPVRKEKPFIYHLDVGAMYPNIILTNRLQPSAIVDDATCAACDYNRSKNNCKRRMKWIWRGDFSPASRQEYEQIKVQLAREPARDDLTFGQLPEKEQAQLVAERLKTYSRKAYMKTKITQEEDREDIVCMRENDFYVNTVRTFRDRRYVFKELKKQWGKKSAGAKDPTEKKHCEDKVLVYDSLQVAHKCILNSFYGYVMRKGARWRSMPMGGIVTKTGADIITQARILVEQIGRPLELDTDGIWCILPKSFPDVVKMKARDGSTIKIEYPGVMLNADVNAKFTNHQYQDLKDAKNGLYETKSECSIFFEVDGPYRCMVLPASTEEGKFLKKRYAVFNFDGSLAELKGFELKRRGELELIKTFQSEVFDRFLDGGNLKECYAAVAEVANYWIDVLDTRGETLDDDELVGLISENRNMSRQLEDYGDQKGTSQTTARRLGEFLGADFIKDKGLNCKFIIAEQPYGAPVTERAIPTAIWKAEPSVMKHFLRKWLKSPGLDGDAMDIRNVLDWDYYMERLGNTIRKIITIPAALQRVDNPVSRVEHPAWLTSRVKKLQDNLKQRDIRSMFARLQKPSEVSNTNENKENNEQDKEQQATVLDMEDIGNPTAAKGSYSKRPLVHAANKVQRASAKSEESASEEGIRLNLHKDDFSDWLKQRKNQWRKSRQERARPSDSRNGQEKRARTSTIEGFVKEAALNLRQNEWHILEIREMSGYDGAGSGSGDFIVWALVGNNALQKAVVSVPRTVFLSARFELLAKPDSPFYEFKRVERILPEGQVPSFLYQISMAESVFRRTNWLARLKPAQAKLRLEDVVEKMYESNMPLKATALAELGSVARLKPSDNSRRKYMLSDFLRVEKPSEGEYLHSSLSYKRLFLYVRMSPGSKTGIVALLTINGGSGSFAKRANEGSTGDVDLTRPSADAGIAGNFDVGCDCRIWIVKPKDRKSQRSLSTRQCKEIFEQLLQTIQDSAADTDYAAIAASSSVRIAKLDFVKSEELALAAANEVINISTRSGSGASLLVVNTSRPMPSLRRFVSTSSSLPIIEMPFPPGRAHDPFSSTLPPIHWEQPAVRLLLEAYLYMMVVSFPKKVSYARYGQIPLGCISADENFSLYEIAMTRNLKRSRGISWASVVRGKPDMGVNIRSRIKSGVHGSENMGTVQCFSQDEIWGDDDALLSPVVRRPGSYRAICVDLDVHDLAIAALTSSLQGETHVPTENKTTSPTSVALFNPQFGNKTAPLGDEMSTRFSLSLLKNLVTTWIRDVFNSHSFVADEVLRQIYRVVASQETLYHDPALHRVLHSLMRTTFMRLLAELQRLGCSVVHATFQKITIATNKISLADAEEHIDFIVKTIQAGPKSDDNEVLSRISLRPRQYHTHFVFLDEYNFGTLHLERVSCSDIDQEETIFVRNQANDDAVVVPSVVTAWSIMRYLESETAQEYFKAIMGRFSMDPFKKQAELIPEDGLLLFGAGETHKLLVTFLKSIISNKFSAYLTRAVGEIIRDCVDDNDMNGVQAALSFISSVVAVLELDSEVENEVQALKRSLLSQVGVAEYAVRWENPCPIFMLADVYCEDCSESRDVNLCFNPPGHDESSSQWVCEDCGTPYNPNVIEQRLTYILQRTLVRYQVQDLRCSKTNRIPPRSLVFLSDCAAPLKTDISRASIEAEIRLLLGLAETHGLEYLSEAASEILFSYR
ncbi:hypothetical protein ACA910_021045 [Epithemia clementina (nom. ined.)]